jgi:predicted membrane protein (TIGR00267 family)
MLKKSIRNLKDFWKIAEISKIARRYFVMNIFDDVLMVLGILLAGFFANLTNYTIITAVTGAAIAVTVSGTWGAYMAESAERKSQIKKLERKVALNLKKSPIGKAHRFAALFLALVNGLPPIIVALIIILPFLLDINLKIAYYISIVLAFFVLFLIGALLGRLSKERLIISGLKMILVGIVCSIIIFLVEKFISANIL